MRLIRPDRHLRWPGMLAAVALLLALLCPAAQGAPRPISLPVDRDNWYAIKWENNLIGYSRFMLENPVQLGDDQFYVLNSTSRIKLGPGEGNEVIFVARLLLNRANLLPNLFMCSQKQGDTELGVECLFTPKLVAQKNTRGSQVLTATVNLDTPSHLLFNNVWGRVDTFLEHYVVLIGAWQAQGQKGELSVYEPVLRGTENIHFEVSGKATVEVLGKETPTRVVLISDSHGQPIVKAYLSEQGSRLVRLDDMHSGFTFTLTDNRVDALVKKAVGVNLYKNRVEFSNVYFPNANTLRNFRALLDVKVNGKADVSRDIRGFRQTFEGTVNEGVIKGTVDVRSSEALPRQPSAYPRRESYAGDLAKYVQAEPGIEARDEEIRSKAEEVAWRSRTSWEAASKITAWVHKSVAEGYSMPSGRYVLQHMAGNSESKALLVVTLLRSVNVPARRVGGIMFTEGNFVPHTWVEVYVGETDGWVAVDPTTGEAGTLGATHVALGDSTDLSSLDVKVLSYSPRPPDRVTFFNRELAWPVGQQRTYSVIHGGKEVGKEIARVKGLIKLDGRDAYEMEFSRDTTLDKKQLTASARLVTTPVVLPLQFSVETTVDSRKIAHRYDFADLLVKENVKVGDATLVQETPLSEGAYVMDPRFAAMYALIIGQLPNPSIGFKGSVFLYDPQTHNTQEMVLQIRQEEKVGVGGEERDTWRCESTDGMSFYIDKKSAEVVRIEDPRQDMVLQLIESATKI